MDKRTRKGEEEMFEKLKERIERNKRVTGLSKAMSIVDAHICPGLTVRALDSGYGQAYTDDTPDTD